jgi:hypothetical protein
MVGAAALAADGVLLLPNGRGEALALAVPPGWAVVGDPAASPDAPVILAPAGADAAAPERIEVARVSPGPDSIEALLDGLEVAWREHCEAVQYGERLRFLTGGFSGIATTMGCTRRLDGIDRGEVQVLTMVPGEDTLWTLRRIWSVPPFDVLATPVPADRLRRGAEEVGRFALCRADAPTDICPAGITDAIAAAGTADTPIILP